MQIDNRPNDHDLPNFIHKNYFRMNTSFLIRTIINACKGKEIALWLGYAQPRINGRGFENDRSLVPERYRYMVGIESYRPIMQEMKRLSQSEDFKLIVYIAPRFSDAVKKVLDDLKILHWEVGPDFNAYMKSNGIKQYVGSTLSISRVDPHPSELGHKLMAESVFEFLKTEVDK